MRLVSAHRALIKDNKIALSNVDRWRDGLRRLNGKRVRITVEEDRNERSMQQNRFYWLYLGLIEAETGNAADDLHEYFKRKHLPPRFVKVFDKEIKLPATTTKLDKLEFMNYMEKICQESGVPIPNPEEL